MSVKIFFSFLASFIAGKTLVESKRRDEELGLAQKLFLLINIVKYSQLNLLADCRRAGLEVFETLL